MCDYSLDFTASRPAKVGDKLVTTAFPTSLTRGFSAFGEPEVAVCLLAGTEVAFEDEVEYDHPLGLSPKGRVTDRVARFRQIDRDRPNVHHDALEFPDGHVVLVHRLCQGQRAAVLQLPASPQSESKEDKREHIDSWLA
jgi:hypothetical protein